MGNDFKGPSELRLEHIPPDGHRPRILGADQLLVEGALPAPPRRLRGTAPRDLSGRELSSHHLGRGAIR